MDSLRALFRWMLLVWLVLVLLLSVLVAQGVDGNRPGNLLAFLFTRPAEPELTPPPPAEATPPPAQPEPAPELPPAPTPEPAPAPAPVQPAEWQPLAQGKKQGSGTLSSPAIRTLEDGAVEVRLAYAGTLGEVLLYRAGNVPSLSIDVMGAWKGQINLDTRVNAGCLSRVQIASHEKWLRISGVAREGKRGLSVKAEYSREAVRLTFTEGKS